MSEVMERIFAAERKQYEAALKKSEAALKKSEAALKEQQKGIAQKLIEGGELALSKIAEYTGLSVSTVRRMAKKLDVAQA